MERSRYYISDICIFVLKCDDENDMEIFKKGPTTSFGIFTWHGNSMPYKCRGWGYCGVFKPSLVFSSSQPEQFS